MGNPSPSQDTPTSEPGELISDELIEQIRAVRDYQFGIQGYLAIYEALSDIVYDNPRDHVGDLQISHVQVGPGFVEDYLKPVLETTYGPLAPLVLHYNGIRTLAHLSKILSTFIALGYFNLEPRERTYVRRYWTKDKLIYA